MDTSHGHGDDGGLYSALDFGDESGGDYVEESVFDALVTDEAVDLGDADTTDAAAEEFAKTAATVTNPPETVSVTATMDGRIYRVDLLPGASGMSESELAEEILAIADLARQQALSIQHEMVVESFRVLGVDDDRVVAEMIESGLTELPSPQQASKAQADVFAARYVSRQ